MGSQNIQRRRSEENHQRRLGMAAPTDSGKPHFVFENRERYFATRPLPEQLFHGFVPVELKTSGFQSWPLPRPVELGFLFGDLHRAVMAVWARPAAIDGKI